MANIREDFDRIAGQMQQSKGTDISADYDRIVSGQQGAQAQSNGAPTGSFGQVIPQLIPEEEKQKSAVNWAKRVKLSFGDPIGNKRDLEKDFSIVKELPNGKFMVGNNPNEPLAPVDPEGIRGDLLGDIADWTGEILVAAGAITGTAIGGSVGALSGGAPAIPGSIMGATIGSGIGSTAKLGIGKILGVRGDSGLEQAVDVAIDTVLGGVAEGAGQALKGAGKQIIKPWAKKALDIGIKSSDNPPKALATMAKILKFSSNMDEKDVIDAGLYGFDNVITKKYLDANTLRLIMNDFAEGLVEKNRVLGEAVKEGRDWAISNFGGKRIGSQETMGKLLNVLSDPTIDLVGANGRLNLSTVTETADKRLLKIMSEKFFAKNPKTGSLVPKNATVKQYLDTKKLLKNQLDDFFNSPKGNSGANRAFAQFFGEMDELTKKAVTPGGVVTPELAQSNKFIRANSDFAQFKTELEQLRGSGLDVRNPNDLKKLFSNGKLISGKIENFLGKLQDKTKSAQDAFETVAVGLPKRFDGGGIGGAQGTLVDELHKFNAAQGFKSANPNMLRFSTILSMFGIGALTEDLPGGKITGAGLGALLATPAGAGILLKSGAKALKAPVVAKTAIKRAIGQVPVSAGRAATVSAGRVGAKKLTEERRKAIAQKRRAR